MIGSDVLIGASAAGVWTGSHVTTVLSGPVSVIVRSERSEAVRLLKRSRAPACEAGALSATVTVCETLPPPATLALVPFVYVCAAVSVARLCSKTSGSA